MAFWESFLFDRARVSQSICFCPLRPRSIAIIGEEAISVTSSQPRGVNASSFDSLPFCLEQNIYRKITTETLDVSIIFSEDYKGIYKLFACAWSHRKGHCPSSSQDPYLAFPYKRTDLSFLSSNMCFSFNKKKIIITLAQDEYLIMHTP